MERCPQCGGKVKKIIHKDYPKVPIYHCEGECRNVFVRLHGKLYIWVVTKGPDRKWIPFEQPFIFR